MATIAFTEHRRHGTGTTTAGVVAEINPVTSIRFHNGVDGSVGATDSPLIRPGTGTNYSWNKFIDVAVSGTFTSISSPMVSAATVSATGELGSDEVYLNYAFQRKGSATGTALVSGDFGEVTNGTDAQPGGISGEVAPAAWNSGTAVAWGGLSTFTTTGEFSTLSASQNTDGDEYLCLQLSITDGVATGGALASFSLTLTYNEV